MAYYLSFNPEWPSIPYVPIPPKHFAIPHHGQRKLLVNEVAFLTTHAPDHSCSRLGDHDHGIVVYAGAAPGVHIIELARLFPDLQFHLYDPREFLEELCKMNNVKCYQSWFTEEIAAKYADLDVLFISDIRTGLDDIIDNMMDQMKWCKAMRPRMASLKFRLPYCTETNKINAVIYFDGDLRLQSWMARGSTECRLWTPCTNLRLYDFLEFEEKMAHYNQNIRLFTTGINIDFGNLHRRSYAYDNCNDCAIEQLTWQSYINRYGRQPFPLIKKIQPLALSPHGDLPHVEPRERMRRLMAQALRFYDNYMRFEGHRADDNGRTMNEVLTSKNRPNRKSKK